MRLIKPKFEILTPTGDISMDIEIAARTCYKSEENITDTSASKMVDNLIASGHTAMLEHGTVYLTIPYGNLKSFYYGKNKYSTVIIKDKYSEAYITTNYRVLVENGWLNDLKYQCEPTEFHEKRISVRFTCDRGVSHEFVRHRIFSFAQESTRFCNYMKAKFGKALTFIIPCWCNIPECDSNDENYSIDGRENHYFTELLLFAEYTYFHLLEFGWKPQQARAVLPVALKTELVMTGTISDWEKFFKLRDAAPAHPQAYELAHPLHEEFIKRGLCS